MSPWRPALRMARRDLRRHKVRGLLTAVLVLLPIIVATVAALGSYNSRYDAERQVREVLGNADAEVMVTQFAAVKPKQALWLYPRPATFDVEKDGSRTPLTRDPAAIDVPALLPEGSTLSPSPSEADIATASGGSASGLFLDPEAEVNEPFAQLLAGRWPTAADEITLGAAAADELGLLDGSGEPRDGATLALAAGQSVKVVGVSAQNTFYGGYGLDIVALPDSSLAPQVAPARRSYLVDLPDLSRPELKALAANLNEAGVAMRPRDAVLNPRAWGLPNDTNAFDVTPLVVGALVILVGMLEVVLLVGAAFSVAARRQVRDLGLLASNGGAAPDVRRVLLAQGFVLGLGSSLVGVAAGIGIFFGLQSQWGSLFGAPLWRHEIDWRSVVLIFVLGSLTSVVAALLPGWNVSRLTVVQALSGRFPIKAGEARAHRGSFVLAGLGLLLVVLGGWLTARSFGPGGREEGLAPAVAALGVILGLAGVVWATPFVVRRFAELGGHLPLSGRYAFRDAGRHRFRSAAATVALAVTVFGAVLAGFSFRSVARAQEAGDFLPPNTMQLYLGSNASPDQVAALPETLKRVVDPIRVDSTYGLSPDGAGDQALALRSSYPAVQVIDRATLARLLGPGHDEALRAYDDGAVIVRGRSYLFGNLAPDRNRVELAVPGARPKDTVDTLPYVVVPRDRNREGYEPVLGVALVKADVVAGYGLEPSNFQVLVETAEPITREQLDRLEVYGLVGSSSDPDRLLVERLEFVGLIAAALLSALVVGVAVALSAAEGRDDVATLAAVGAAPRQRRALGAMHGLFLGSVGVLLGVATGIPAGLAFTQVDGLPGIDVPWGALLGTIAVVLVMSPLAGWVVTPARLRLTRRTN